ncbi:IS256 family transposase [Porphyromonadaceae bacterium W3.11]|nr:IS256 family transposase [Porphyromonadaceae bacterium W3.11]MDN4754924.1 IS256 family transposase [Porphyromonadaceae bacterium W3.11]
MQFKEILSNVMTEPNGVGRLMELIIEIAMQGERELYKEDSGDVSNGYRPRRIFASGNMLELRVPRTRQQGFMPLILGVLKDQEKEMGELAGYLYSCGNTMEDISGVFECLYGKRYSTSQINRLSLSTQEAVEEWRQRRLPRTLEALVIDATYLPVRRGESVSKEAFFVVMSLDSEGRRDIVGVYNNPTEGSGIWGEFFEDLKSRGLEEVGLIISDGLNNIEEVAREHFTEVEVQLCTVHLQREITRKIRPRDKSAIASDLQEVFSKDGSRSSPLDGLESFKNFAFRWRKSYPFLTKIANGQRIEYYFTYLKYDVSVRKYIHSTNWIERFNRQVKKGARYKCALPSVESALHLIGSIAINANYLKKRIGDLTLGLRKNNEK